MDFFILWALMSQAYRHRDGSGTKIARLPNFMDFVADDNTIQVFQEIDA